MLQKQKTPIYIGVFLLNCSLYILKSAKIIAAIANIHILPSIGSPGGGTPGGGGPFGPAYAVAPKRNANIKILLGKIFIVRKSK